MGKTEVYSWRLSAEQKTALEEAARRMRCSMADLLDSITRVWLEEEARRSADDEGQQARLRAAAERAIGTISGGGASRSENVRLLVRERLRRRRAG